MSDDPIGQKQTTRPTVADLEPEVVARYRAAGAQAYRDGSQAHDCPFAPLTSAALSVRLLKRAGLIRARKDTEGMSQERLTGKDDLKWSMAGHLARLGEAEDALQQISDDMEDWPSSVGCHEGQGAPHLVAMALDYVERARGVLKAILSQ